VHSFFFFLLPPSVFPLLHSLRSLSLSGVFLDDAARCVCVCEDRLSRQRRELIEKKKNAKGTTTRVLVIGVCKRNRTFSEVLLFASIRV
jgi:hypothetical protein